MGRELNPLLSKEIERLNFKLAEVEFQRDNLQSEINRLKEENEKLKAIVNDDGELPNIRPKPKKIIKYTLSQNKH